MGGGGGSNGASVVGGTPSPDEYKLAVRLIKHEKYSDAIPHLFMALADKPNSTDILNYIGYAYRMIGNYRASLDYHKRALAIEPDHKGTHEYLGELYLQTNDLTSAQAELTTLTGLCPSGCDERDMLTKAIAIYTPPATATAAAPATTASRAPKATTAGQ
jgi:tetratricopeptide (TPR) repeat protein